MSQAGIVDFEGSHPQVPTLFVANVGSAVPIANTLEILGTAVSAHSIPLETTGSGNTITIEAQYTSASGSSSANNAGLASFNSTYFNVDANGFVTLNGSSIGETITGNTGGALSPDAGNWNILGTSTAAGTTPVQTSGSGNTLTVQVQKSQAIASTNASNVGLAAFNSTYFTVDANGFVSLVAASLVESLVVDTFTAPGTNPVLPNSSGQIGITGGQVAAGTTTNVIRTDSLAANTYTIQIQRSQAVASSTVGDNGVSHFNSTYFTVDGNGFVSINGSAIGETITGNTGGALSPTSGNWNILGTSTAPGTNPVQTSGSASTLTIQVQKSQAIASTNATNVGLAAFNSTYFTVDSNGFVSINGSAIGETITGNTGGALSPTAGNWNILGSSTAAGTTPVQTSGSVSTLTVQVQKAQAIASTNATNVGLAAFNSTYFTVDANGFVSLVASAVGGQFTVDASTAPGTNPVVPNGSGIITVTGGQVAAGTTSNVIRTDSLAANTYTIQIQRSQAVAASTVGDNGVSHFNSTYFTVDSNGFVSLNGSGVGETITGNTGGALSPTSGNWNILGTSTAAGTTPVQTSGSGSTLTVQVQKSQAIASTNATNVGLAAFNSTYFTVDANGFVSLNGSGVGETITGNAGGALSPTSGNWNILGTSTAAGTTPVQTSGSGSTLTVQVQKAQAIASTNATNVGLAAFNSAQFSVDANGFVSTTGSVATTYTENSGTATPSAGNLNILGTNSALTGFSPWTTGSGATVTVNKPGTAKWIVNATANLGTHTTIASALTSASSGETIFITPGTYTENITLKAGVNLTAFQCDAYNPNVIILGKCTATFAGICSLSGIQLKTNSDFCLAVTGSAATVVNLKGCFIDANNNTAISFTTSSASAKIQLFDCKGDIDTTGITYFSHSSAGALKFFGGEFENDGGSTTASTASAGGLNLYNCFFNAAITTSSTNVLTILSSQMYMPVIVGGSGSNQIALCAINGATSSAISVSSSTTLVLTTCDVYSTNTNAITGSGSLTYSGLTFSGSSSKINTTTQTGGTLPGGLTQAPSAGYLGEQIRATASKSSVGITNSTPVNITSISLTAGVWDVSALVEFGGATTGTLIACCITATSATLNGNEGDNQSQWPFTSQANSEMVLTIPSYRITLTSTTTYYLVAQMNYTVGTGTGGGRLSATRVG